MSKLYLLKPLATADLLDASVDLMRNNLVLFVGITAALNTPERVVNAFSYLGRTRPAQNWIWFPLYLAFGALTAGALTFAISERYLGRKTCIFSCCRVALRRNVFLPLLGAQILIWVTAFVAVIAAALVCGMLLFVRSIRGFPPTFTAIAVTCAALLGAPFIVRLALAGPAVVIEGLGARAALRRSIHLTKGHAIKTISVLIPVYAVAIIPAISASYLLARLSGHSLAHLPPALRIAQVWIGWAMSLATAPLVSAATTLLYYDLRVRKEGFDLELLSEELSRYTPAEA